MREFTALREKLFRGQPIPECFHAAEDKQHIRDAVFAEILRWGNFEMHVSVFEKTGAPASHREKAKFYTFAADFSLRAVLECFHAEREVFVVTDRIPVAGKRNAIVKGFKASLAAVRASRSYHIEHHASGSQACLQAADYVNWAVFRKWERDDLRSYDLVRDKLARESNLDWRNVR